MDANELFKAGKLQEAIDAQIAQVKANAADHSKRLFLFELLAFAGEIDRARKQVDVLNYDEMELAAAAAEYRKILDAEQLRRDVFHKGALPKFLTDKPPEHARLRLEALAKLREGNKAGAAELLAAAAEVTPNVIGTIDGKPVDGLRDCDDLFGGVLEVFAQGSYFWVPLETVGSLGLNAPRYPRDLLWAPARLETQEGESGSVFLPALYPDSHTHADDQIKLGRQTDWLGDEDDPVIGRGLRMFLMGDDTTTVLEWRKVIFEPQPEEPAKEAEMTNDE